MEPNRIICTHRPSHCHSARIFSWSTPSCVYIYEIFHGQGFSVVKEVQSTLWGIPVRLSSGWVCEVHECRLYSYALTLLYISMLSITFAKIRKNAVSTKLFSTYFSPQKSPFSISFYSKKKDVTYLYFIFLPVETRAMIFFLHEKMRIWTLLSPTYHITHIW